MTNLYRMNEVVRMIRADGSATVVLEGERVDIGFVGAGKSGELIMVGGGYYVVSTLEGRKFNIAKGELVKVL